MVAPDALSRNPLSHDSVEPYEGVEPLYAISSEFVSAVSPCGVSLYMKSFAPEAQAQLQVCTVCMNMSTRPLSPAGMEEHINGRRQYHFLRMASSSSSIYERRLNGGRGSNAKIPTYKTQAHHGRALNTDSLYLLTEADQIFKEYSLGRSRPSPDTYFKGVTTPIPHITLAVVTRSSARTLARPADSKHSRKQAKKVQVPITDTESKDGGVANAAPSDVMADSQSTDMATVVTCKQCNQSCPITAFSPSQLRKWEANSVCRSCLVELEVPMDTPALLENPFLAPPVVVPDPRFILADNSDPMSQQLPARPVDNIEVDPEFQHVSLNKWMVAQRADSILNQIIEFITNGKVTKGITVKTMRERSLPYLIDRGVLMRRITYRKAELV